MHTPEQAGALWCPMVRVARHEMIIVQDPSIGGLTSRHEEHHVVGGCNSASGPGRGPRNPASSRCIADQCAMWRWEDNARPPEPRDKVTFWPNDERDSAVERMRKTEPTRHAKVPADAIWVPVTGPKYDCEGGYWEEPQEKVDADNEKAAADFYATRRGYCGMAGSPR